MSKLLALSSGILHSHVVAVDSVVPALRAVIEDSLLSSCNQPVGYELEDGNPFEGLIDSPDDDDDDDDEVYKCVVCPLLFQRRAHREKPSDAIQVLDISVSVAAPAESTRLEPETTDVDDSGVQPISVSTAPPSVDRTDPSTHCSYRKGQCKQPRTLKSNGFLHTLCAHHRDKSIANQRAFDGKKRSVSGIKKAANRTATPAPKKATARKKKSRAKSKKVTRAAPQQQPSVPKRQRISRKTRRPAPAQTQAPSSTMAAAAAPAKPREVEALGRNESLQARDNGDEEKQQHEREFFAEFTRVLDGRQLSKAKQLAVTQFLRDVLL